MSIKWFWRIIELFYWVILRGTFLFLICRIVDFCITGGHDWVGKDHAYFLKKEDGYYLVDNNSMNHTWLNGQQLVSNQPYAVKAGDVIRMADEEFELLPG